MEGKKFGRFIQELKDFIKNHHSSNFLNSPSLGMGFAPLFQIFFYDLKSRPFRFPQKQKYPCYIPALKLLDWRIEVHEIVHSIDMTLRDWIRFAENLFFTCHLLIDRLIMDRSDIYTPFSKRGFDVSKFMEGMESEAETVNLIRKLANISNLMIKKAQIVLELNAIFRSRIWEKDMLMRMNTNKYSNSKRISTSSSPQYTEEWYQKRRLVYQNKLGSFIFQNTPLKKESEWKFYEPENYNLEFHTGKDLVPGFPDELYKRNVGLKDRSENDRKEIIDRANRVENTLLKEDENPIYEEAIDIGESIISNFGEECLEVAIEFSMSQNYPNVDTIFSKSFSSIRDQLTRDSPEKRIKNIAEFAESGVPIRKGLPHWFANCLRCKFGWRLNDWNEDIEFVTKLWRKIDKETEDLVSHLSTTFGGSQFDSYTCARQGKKRVSVNPPLLTNVRISLMESDEKTSGGRTIMYGHSPRINKSSISPFDFFWEAMYFQIMYTDLEKWICPMSLFRECELFENANQKICLTGHTLRDHIERDSAHYLCFKEEERERENYDKKGFSKIRRAKGKNCLYQEIKDVAKDLDIPLLPNPEVPPIDNNLLEILLK